MCNMGLKPCNPYNIQVPSFFQSHIRRKIAFSPFKNLLEFGTHFYIWRSYIIFALSGLNGAVQHFQSVRRAGCVSVSRS